ANDFNASCIFIDDRTTHDSKLKIGWGMGTPDRYYLKDYVSLVVKISKELGIKNNKIVYYDSSAGSFMSIAMPVYHKGNTAIFDNPQTYVNNYYKTYVNQIYENIFVNERHSEILKKYSGRFSLLNLMARKKYVPKIFYLQNRKCKSDLISQVNPFLEN